MQVPISDRQATALRAKTAPGAAGGIARLLPGISICVAVSVVAIALERIEAALAGRAWIEALVLAILVGTIVRTAWTPAEASRRGITFCAKTLLEIAVLLLGATVSVRAIVAAGPLLLLGIAATVGVAITASYAIGRALRLPARMAVLIACGNSICGNSAIAAVAPVIGADAKDVAASIAFTAVLGVVVVLLLPLLVPLMHLSALQYGVVAGLTVYAVPQVLAATAPIGPLAVQFGTLVKLVRVLMLGPVVLFLSLLARRKAGSAGTGRLNFGKLIPWFILGFLALAGLRWAGVLPEEAVPAIAVVTNLFTVVAMAALGLGTDLRAIARAGGPVIVTVVASLLLLGAISLLLIRVLAIA